jgi:chromosome segregation protein
MLKRLEIVGFKSFAKKTVLEFVHSTTAIVGPNGSGKSNVAEAFRFALGEQSMKSMRGKRAEDLIWGGSHTAPRANRASVVVVFDNTKHEFNVDFDEVSIERTVFRDGASEYAINGSKVRLRDVIELLASQNIGNTGHHIISQGEADRILLASAKDRRAMLEDALGLKVYEFKKQEALKKLEKTDENIGQVNSLRRELAPHLRFLEKQVEKLERAESVKAEFTALARTYFATEDAYLAQGRKKVAADKAQAAERLKTVSAELAQIENEATTDREGLKGLDAVRASERELEKVQIERSTLARELGRVEGALTAAKERSTRVAQEPYAKVPRADLVALAEEVEKQFREAGTAEALRVAFSEVTKYVKLFVGRFAAPADELLAEEEQSVYDLEHKRTELVAKDEQFAKVQEAKRLELARAREALTAHDEAGKEVRRRILEFAQTKANEERALAESEGRARELTMLAEALDRAKAEAGALAGMGAVSYEPLAEALAEDRRTQEERRRTLERLQIRLEELGGADDDIRKEHKEASERETFLKKELEDLTQSAGSLRELIAELDAELAKFFTEGLKKVNESFGEYFKLMFDGGSARLAIEELEKEEDDEGESAGNDEEEKERAGIESAVNLPKKKVRSLMQLSGGERALTSIALIFAMSQVNPPPFLILNETDAALDEANSRRYGDMIESLANHSQLIVITHNRETMGRAGILYGVTMGNDGISKLLSVKLDEAIAVAK